MPLLRIVTDLKVDKEPGQEDLEKTRELFRQFAHGVVPVVLLEPSDEAVGVTSHTHVSNEDYSCGECVEHARDQQS